MKPQITRRSMRRRPLPPRSWPLVTLWLDPDVIAHFCHTDHGWQGRINAILRKAAKLPKEKRKRA